MRILFTLIIMLMICAIPVGAVTMSDTIRINESFKPNDIREYNVQFTKESVDKTPVNFSYISKDGDCEKWVSLDKQSFIVNDKVNVKLKINVPPDVTQNVYRCNVYFNTPPSGLSQMSMGIPISAKIGGSTVPLTTQITTIQTTIPTIITTQPTIKKPVVQTTVQPVKETNSSPVKETPSVSAIIFISLVILGLMLLIVAIGVVYFNKY